MLVLFRFKVERKSSTLFFKPVVNNKSEPKYEQCNPDPAHGKQEFYQNGFEGHNVLPESGLFPDFIGKTHHACLKCKHG